MSTPWGAPQTTQGFQTGEYVGAVVLITPTLYEPSVPTTYGDKDAVTCHITVCYNPNDPSKNGEEFANARIFNVVMVSALRNSMNGTVGGRISREQGQGGNTKLVLAEVSDDNSVAYLNHCWPTHCDSFKVNTETGELLNPKGQATVAREGHEEAGAPANTAPPAPPATPPAPAQQASTPPPPPPPTTPAQPEQPPF